MSTGLLKNLQISDPPFLRSYNPIKCYLTEAAQVSGQRGHSIHGWLHSTMKRQQHHDGSEDRGRGKFLISNYTWTCSLSAECLLTSFSAFLPPHLFKKKESSCRQLLIKYLGFQLQLLYAHICSALNSVNCNWLIFHALGENIYDMKKKSKQGPSPCLIFTRK